MSVLKIYTWPSAVLEQRAQEVSLFDANLRKLVEDLQATMHHHQGVGLAANQVGVLQRVLVMHHKHYKEDGPRLAWHDKDLTFINPCITKKQGKTRTMEGCLSFPEIWEYVERAEEIWVEAQDATGQTFTTHATGILSICLQHEMDHLDGLVFVKRLSRLKYNLVKKKLQKLQTME